ncbi:disulfide bond formation protein DsbA [Novosphingobium sp. PC22D]|uniref:DsbA family protein n=1 Tax=Novosphingobium sp. PC22D TaxID=1962403 RepID=UPI000BF22CA2|nr:DsbA family protein [Novosphingobium sp. PC22D]PEQ12198.1 disulfide bond formation protein DsbA [Novosphingobium sp. PC22D]
MNGVEGTGGKSALGIGLVIALVLLAAIAGWFAERVLAGPGARDRAAIEDVVREYILANPEIIPEAMDNLRRKESRASLGAIRDEVERPFPGAILGNPQGKVTLVEFTDFACGFCRRSMEDVEALIAENPDLKVVIRELPILSPQSAEAARMGLAAAEQGKYAAFHRAMFEAGQPDPAAIEAAARTAGLDIDRARKTAKTPRVEQELASNVDLAGKLGFSGTPSWVVGDEVITGAVGREALAEAIETARGG